MFNRVDNNTLFVVASFPNDSQWFFLLLFTYLFNPFSLNLRWTSCSPSKIIMKQKWSHVTWVSHKGQFGVALSLSEQFLWDKLAPCYEQLSGETHVINWSLMRGLEGGFCSSVKFHDNSPSWHFDCNLRKDPELRLLS